MRSGGEPPLSDTERLLREILASQARYEQRVTDLADRLDQTHEDAREARDLGKRIEATLREQNVGSRLMELRRDIREELAALRQDTVLAIGNLRTEVVAIDERVKTLENDRTARGGMKSMIEWVLRYAPWLLAGIAAFMAGLFGRNDLMPK